MNRLQYVLAAALAAPLIGAADGSKPSAKPPASKNKTAQTPPVGAEPGLSQTRNGTLPAPVGSGPNQSIYFRVRTEGEETVLESNFQTDLKSTGQFHVGVQLQGIIEPGAVELAPEVARQIGLARPRNTAGRKAAFPRWEVVKGSGSNYKGLVVPLGWSLHITEVTPLPDGWRALVRVSPLARSTDGRGFTVYNYFFESYRFKDGKLKLEFEAPDLFRDPRDGLCGWVKY